MFTEAVEANTTDCNMINGLIEKLNWDTSICVGINGNEIDKINVS